MVAGSRFKLNALLEVHVSPGKEDQEHSMKDHCRHREAHGYAARHVSTIHVTGT